MIGKSNMKKEERERKDDTEKRNTKRKEGEKK